MDGNFAAQEDESVILGEMPSKMHAVNEYTGILVLA